MNSADMLESVNDMRNPLLVGSHAARELKRNILGGSDGILVVLCCGRSQREFFVNNERCRRTGFGGAYFHWCVVRNSHSSMAESIGITMGYEAYCTYHNRHAPTR